MGIFDLFKKPVDIERLINSRDLTGLKDALQGSDPAVQIQAAAALAGYGQSEGLAFLNTCLQNSKESIRLAAIEALGDSCDDRAVDYLIPLLNSRDDETRETAAAALAHYDTPAARAALRTVEPLTEEKKTPDSDGARDLNLVPADPIMGINPYVNPVDDLPVSPVVDRSARDLFILANSHEEEGRYMKALEEVNAVIARAPGWADAYNLRGIIFEGLEKPFQAMLSYQWAVKLDPSLRAAANNLADLIRENEVLTSRLEDWQNDLLEQDDWQARMDAICALNQRPEPDALRAVIDALQDTDTEVASMALEALQANPQPEAHHALLEYFGSQPGADDEWIAPGDADFVTDLAEVDAAGPATVSPNILSGPIFIPEPMRPDLCLKAADYSCENAEFDRAYLLARYADLLDPGNPDVQNQMGIIHECREEFMQADFAYRRAIQLDPGFNEARNNLQELETEFGAPLDRPLVLMADLEDTDPSLVLRAVVTLGEMEHAEAAEYIQPLIENDNMQIAVAAAVALAQINRQAYQEAVHYVYHRLGDISLTQTIDTHPDQVVLRSARVTAERAKLLPLLFSPAHSDRLLKAAQNEFDRMAELQHPLSRLGIDGLSEIRDLFFQIVYWEIYRRYNPDMFIGSLQEMDGRVREIDVVLARVFEGWLSDPAPVISKQMLTAWSTIPDLVSGDVVIHPMDTVRQLASARMK